MLDSFKYIYRLRLITPSTQIMYWVIMARYQRVSLCYCFDNNLTPGVNALMRRWVSTSCVIHIASLEDGIAYFSRIHQSFTHICLKKTIIIGLLEINANFIMEIYTNKKLLAFQKTKYPKYYKIGDVPITGIKTNDLNWTLNLNFLPKAWYMEEA